jgi:hypothetical protein
MHKEEKQKEEERTKRKNKGFATTIGDSQHL